MFNGSTITKAIYEQLKRWHDLDDTIIERSERVNIHTSRMPWVGIYPGSVVTDPNVLATNSCKRWRETGKPRLLLQESGFSDDGQEAADALDTLIEKVLNCLVSDLTFGLTNVRLTNIDREYTYVQMDDDSEGDIFFPQCEITLTLDVRS